MTIASKENLRIRCLQETYGIYQARRIEAKLKRSREYAKDNQKHDEANSFGSALETMRNDRRRRRRDSSRAAFLARAYARGTSYKTLEQSVKDPVYLHKYIVPLVQSVLRQEGFYSSKSSVETWFNA